MTETIEIVANPEHLERALANKRDRNFDCPCQCLIAEACKDVMPDFMDCGITTVQTFGKVFRLPHAGVRLIALFDSAKYDEIHLPQTITLTRCE